MQELPMVPDYVHRAFEDVYMADANQEKYEAFASSWKGLDAATFRHIIEVGEGKDKVVAIFALGYMATPQAREAMVLLLHSPVQQERWASALCLGAMQDERALPYLQQMLVEGLSLEERPWAMKEVEDYSTYFPQIHEADWYDDLRTRVVKYLEPWHSPSLVQIMLQAFKTLLWQLEYAIYPYAIHDDYYDALAYALGQQGAFGVLAGFELPPAYVKTAMVYLALGYLQAQMRYSPARGLISEMMMNAALQREVAEVLGQRFGLSEAEQDDCVAHFYENDQARGFAVRRTSQEDEEDTIDEDEDEDEGDEGDEYTIESIDPKPLTTYTGHHLQVNSLSWSPDGLLVSSGSNDTTAQVWQATIGKTITTFRGHTSSVTVVAWSPDGRYLASGGSDNMVYVWDATTGEQVSAYAGHTFWILRGLCWSPDGTRIASGSWDGTVQVWDAFSGETLLIYRGHSGIVYSVAWSPDGTRVASGGGYPECLVKVWDATTGHTLLTYRGHTAEEGETLILKSGDIWSRGDSSVHCLAWSPDGTRLASVGARSDTHVWEAVTGKDVLTSYRTNEQVAWSPNGTSIMSPSINYGVNIWQATTNKLITKYFLEEIISVDCFSWSHNGHYLVATGRDSAGQGIRVKVWKLREKW